MQVFFIVLNLIPLLALLVLRIVGRRIIEYFLKRKIAHITRVLTIIEQYDPLWNREELEEVAGSMFREVNMAWSEKNLELLKSQVSENVFKFMKDRIVKLNRKGRKNIMENIGIDQIHIVDVRVKKGNIGSMFTAHIRSSIDDYYLDSMGRKITRFGFLSRGDPNESPRVKLHEFWTFKHINDGWVVERGEQGHGYGLNYLGSRITVDDRELRWKLKNEDGNFTR
jgi:predicted lipid-binding transport protein (Tim44 family)